MDGSRDSAEGIPSDRELLLPRHCWQCVLYQRINRGIVSAVIDSRAEMVVSLLRVRSMTKREKELYEYVQTPKMHMSRPAMTSRTASGISTLARDLIFTVFATEA